MAIITDKCFKELMGHYRKTEDRDKQLQLLHMSEKDILVEYLNVFGLEGGIYE